MIQINRTIFQFTKRLALVIMLIGISSTALGLNSSTYYEKVKATTNQNASGLIYMSETPVAEGGEIPYSNQVAMEIVVSSWAVSSAQTVYLYANKNSVSNALWAGWFNNSNQLLGSGDANITVQVTPTVVDDETPDLKDQIFTAKWVKPQVTGNAVTLDLGTITNKNDTITPQTAEYAIAEYTSTDHFKVDPNSVNNFSITLKEVTEATTNLTGTATILVNYTPRGRHGENLGTAYVASSLYNGNYTETNTNLFKPIYFKVMEDYTPDFEVVHNTSTNVYSVGTTNVDGVLTSMIPTNEVHSKNYAASAEKYTGAGQQQNRTTWTATIANEETGYEGLFTIIAGANSETPTIQFNAAGRSEWGLGTGESKTVTAELQLSCTYYDESNPAVAVPMPTPKTIYLSATVTQINEAKLLFGDLNTPTTSYDFDLQAIGGNASTSIPVVALNIENLQEPAISGAHSQYFEAKLNGSNIEISIKKDASIPCGDITAQIALTGRSSLDHETEFTATLNVTADMYLSKPIVTSAGGNQSITFRWDPVFGATGYRAYATEDATTFEYIEGTTFAKTVNNSTTLKYWFTAVNASGCESEKFGPVSETAELSTIHAGNANATGLKTGTAHQGTGFPWREVRDIDVSAAFNAAGEPIFDELHIFALSTGTTEASLTTPCLKYVKSNNQYVKEGADISEKKGNITKNSIYKFDNITTNKKIYITGYRPYATTGSKTDEGVMYLKGGNVTLDLYLDNCEIYAQSKATGTSNRVSHDIELSSISDIPSTGYFAKGSGSVLVFESTSENANHPFNVNIHFRGDNTLDATIGTKTTMKITEQNQELISDNKINHYCSPISISPNNPDQVVRLVIDDIWDVQGRTNGILHLEEKDADNASKTSIALGNSKTELHVNGGQIYFQQYAARYQSITYTYTNEGNTISVDAYGLGTTNSSPAKTIKDASSIMLLDGTFNGSTPAFYATNFAIDGGTFNTTVKHYKGEVEQTELKNSDGKTLKLFEITNTENKYWNLTATGIANLTESFPTMVDDLFPEAGVNITNALSSTGSYHYPLSLYYMDGRDYGHASLAPTDNKIKLYLPELSCNDIHHAWQICAPNFYLEALGRKYVIGGGENVINVCPEHSDHKYTTDYFMYMQSDQFVMDALGTTYFTPMNLGYGDIIIGSDNDKLNSSVSTADAYTINKKVYMLMPIEAAKWTLFAPPFDVANIYVIESYPENQLVKDYGGKRGKIPAQNVENARIAQASRIVDLYAMWYFEGKGMESMSDFFADGTSDLDADGTPDLYGRFVSDWIKYEAETNYMQQEGGDYTPVIEKLIHFAGKNADYSAYGEGKNWLDANYYLYQQKPEGWTFDGTHYTCGWDTVTTVANGTNAIMNKGQVYAIQFPYNSINGTHDPSTTWDYWTGKYLLIESTAGPHTINGSNFVTSALSAQNVASNTASLFGNSTFAEIAATLPTREGTNTTMWALEKKSATEEGERDIHEMVQKNIATLAPTSGVLLANFQAPKNMIAKSINYTTGEITYEKIDDPNTGDIETGLPTIMGDLTLLVESTPEGLCITPIKEQHVMLFDADGKMIFSKYLTAEENVTLPTGVYVVRGEYEQVKAIKK